MQEYENTITWGTLGKFLWFLFFFVSEQHSQTKLDISGIECFVIRSGVGVNGVKRS